MDIEKLKRDIAEGKEQRFYSSDEWHGVRESVIKLDCYRCTACGWIFRRPSQAIVHHVEHIKDNPDKALDVWDKGTGARQLVTVCRRCHRDIHDPERFRKVKFRYLKKPKPKKEEPITVERWD